MKGARFKKGQLVYQACPHFGEFYPGTDSVRVGLVIERTVDACGKKKVTFENHGRDSVFGRSSTPSSRSLFEKREEAYDYLKGLEFHPLLKFVVLEGEFSDRNDDPFKMYYLFEEQYLKDHK